MTQNITTSFGSPLQPMRAATRLEITTALPRSVPRHSVIFSIVHLLLMLAWMAPGQPILAEDTWYRGNLHTHSLWSDGNDFPDMVARWFKNEGYHFLALTDHNILSQGEKWMTEHEIKNRGGETVIQKYLAAYGEDWVEFRGDHQLGTREVRLKTLEEVRGQLEQPGRFLMIQSEEISDSLNRLPIHMNAANIEKLARPTGGDTVRETIVNNLRAVQLQSQQTGKPVLFHLNHPNFGWAVSCRDLAMARGLRFVEVYNGHPAINHLGGSRSPAVERMWDIANTIRLDQLNEPPLLGLATDDSHHYHDRPTQDSRPGRGWVMVRARTLSTNAILQAMNRGDFYLSSGVALADVNFNPDQRRLSLQIREESGVSYHTRFIGTRRNYDRRTSARQDSDGKAIPDRWMYSDEIGTVLAESDDLQPHYVLQDDDLFVRAVVTSSRQHPNASFPGQFEQAWTQPVHVPSVD